MDDESNYAILGKSCFKIKKPHQHIESIEWKTLLGKIPLVTNAVAAALLFCSGCDNSPLT